MLKKTLLFFVMLLLLVSAYAKTIQIITLNDLHGHVAAENNGKQGLLPITGYLNDYMKSNPNTLVVSCGDNYQGSMMSDLSKGALVNDIFQTIPISISAVGNHEFDWGVDQFSVWEKQGKLDYLAANIIDTKTGDIASFAKPYKILTIDGKRIAFIGLATKETVKTTLATHLTNLKFIDAATAAKKWVAYLKSGKAGKVDAIIALTHIPSTQNTPNAPITGDEMTALAKVKGLDAILSAHNHVYIDGFDKGVPIEQAKCYGAALGDVTLTFDDATGKLTNTKLSLIKLDELNKTYKSTPKAQAIYNSYDQKFKTMGSTYITTAKSAMPFDHNNLTVPVAPLGNYFASLLQKTANTDVAIINGGGIRAGLPKGKITFSDVYDCLPFDNEIFIVKLNGKMLKSAIEHGLNNPDVTSGQFSGISVTIDSSKPFGQQLISAKLTNGKEVKDNQYYTVAINDFMALGGDNYDFDNAKEKNNTHIIMRDAVLKLMKATKEVPTISISNCVIDKTAKNAMPKVAQKNSYKIQPGDTLGEISKENHTTISNLADINHIINPNMIHAGQMIQLQ